MHRRHAVRAALVAIAIVTSSCRELADVPPPEGSIEISFVSTAHLRFSRLDYRISGNEIVERTGSVSLVDDGATPSALVGGLPEGQGYLLQLQAASDDGAGFCYGAAGFNVVGGESTPVGITLVCSTQQTVRTKVVDGGTDYCPSLASYAASPEFAPVG